MGKIYHKTIASEVTYIYLRLALGVTRYKLKELITKQDRNVKSLLEEGVKPPPLTL